MGAAHEAFCLLTSTIDIRNNLFISLEMIQTMFICLVIIIKQNAFVYSFHVLYCYAVRIGCFWLNKVINFNFSLMPAARLLFNLIWLNFKVLSKSSKEKTLSKNLSLNIWISVFILTALYQEVVLMQE